MKFDYTQIGENFYPLIDVELISLTDSVITKAYVDSGATYSIFKMEIAEILNIDVESGKKIFPIGIGGHICAYIHNVRMKVGDVEFDTDVLISDELLVRFNILGRIGLFDRFKICFEDKSRVLELTEI